MDLREVVAEKTYRHPWEVARANFIIKKILEFNPSRIIDIGSGDGYMANRIAQAANLEVIYIDKNFTREQLRLPNHFSDISYVKPMINDLILLADVLEHIEKSENFMISLKEHFLESTKVIISVPAFQCLFSEHDIFLGHYRRYTNEILKNEIQSSLVIERTRYFFFLPLLIRWIQIRVLKKVETKAVSNWSFPDDHPISLLSLCILNFDLRLSWLPGLSLLLVGRIKK